MKTINASLIFIFALSISAAANAAGSMLRITCEGDNAGAAVYINGKLKGECPLDMKVPVGKIKLRATKPSDEDHEARVFEQEIYMGEGVAKKVELRLGEGELTAAGRVKQAEKDEAYAKAMAVYEDEMRAYKEKSAEYSELQKKCEYEKSDEGHRAACENWVSGMKRWDDDLFNSCVQRSYRPAASCDKLGWRSLPEEPQKPKH